MVFNSRKNPKEIVMEVVIETEKGTMRASLFPEAAPVTVQNFLTLIESGFYDGLLFHRVEPGFVIQTGDPTGTGAGGSEMTVPLEIHPDYRHDEAGVLGMARTSDPNSGSSQFYIGLAPLHMLDDKYTVFGKLTEGVDVAQSIVRGDAMLKVTVSVPALTPA
jgi:peptidyl-prolyl cis-trans isomerase B (cyclophilin B)